MKRKILIKMMGVDKIDQKTIPRISVLMTVYNGQDFINQAIESILSQTFTQFEFVIIDDASTDNTWELIQNYVALDSRIRAYRNNSNLGIAKNRNQLLKLALAGYIAWQDADDISLPMRLEKQYNFLETNPLVGIVGGWLELFNQQGSIGVRRYQTDDRNLRRKIFRYSPVAQPVAMIRQEAIKKIKAQYDSRFEGTEDLLMSFKIGEIYQFANLPEVLLRYRVWPGSITHRKLKRLEKQTLAIRWLFKKSSAYHLSLVDWCYNGLQALTLYLMPSRCRFWLFNLIRRYF